VYDYLTADTDESHGPSSETVLGVIFFVFFGLLYVPARWAQLRRAAKLSPSVSQLFDGV